MDEKINIKNGINKNTDDLMAKIFQNIYESSLVLDEFPLNLE